MRKAGLLAILHVQMRRLLTGHPARCHVLTATTTSVQHRLKRALMRPFHWVALVGVRLMLVSPLMEMPRQTRQRWEAILLAVVGAVTVIAITIGSWRALNQEMLQTAASSTAYMVEEGLSRNEHDTVRGTLRRLAYFPGVSSVRIYNARGTVFERWSSPGSMPRDENQLRFLGRMLDMDIYLPIMDGDMPIGGVEITARADHMLKTLREALLLSGVLCGVLLFMIGIWYRRRHPKKSSKIPPSSLNPQDIVASMSTQGHHASLLEGMLSFKTEIDSAYTRLLFQATHDALTRTYNRFYFDLFFEHAMKHSHEHTERFGLIFIDCNRFKQINDEYGHLCGDQVLKTVAERLRDRFDGRGDVFRYGGDEFAMLIHNLPDDSYLQSLVDEVPRLFDMPVKVDSVPRPLDINVACGGATYPVDGDNARQLMRSADGRMYAHKMR